MSEQRFTIFSSDCHQGNDYDKYRDLSLQDFIDLVASEYSNFKLIAWAAEATTFDGGAKDRDALRAESIAAGRLIKKVDGKYIALGVELNRIRITGDSKHDPFAVEQEEQPLFRIGGCYRQQNGDVVRVVREVVDLGFYSSIYEGHGAIAVDTVSAFGVGGWRRKSDGVCLSADGNKLDHLSLLPEEVDTDGNPINTEKPATISHDREDVFEDYSGPDNITAATQDTEKPALDGSEFLGRYATGDDLTVATVKPAQMPCTCGVPVTGVVHRTDGPCHLIAATQERKQPPLDWNPKARTPYDPFKEFAVSSGCSDQDSYPDSHTGVTHSPDLQRAGHQVAPMFGSAANLGKCA